MALGAGHPACGRRGVNVSTEALTLALLLPPAVFGTAVAVESWRSHRATMRAMRRHPSSRTVCPDCGGAVFDMRTHKAAGYCEARR